MNEAVGAGLAIPAAAPVAHPAPPASPPPAGHTSITGIRIAVATARNLRSRNEDAVGVAGWTMYGEGVNPIDVYLAVTGSSPALVAIADGMGGQPDGHHAARIAAERLTCRREAVSPADVLTTAFRDADASIRAATDDRSRGMGCTAAAVLIRADGTATVANLGDVRVYRVLDGYPGQLTEDHRPYATGSTVSRCLGGARTGDPTPYWHQVPVHHGDRLIMCSDGVHDAIGAEGMLRATRHAHRRTVLSSLVRAALATDHSDNITAVVLDLFGAAPPPVPRRPEIPR
jgi:serine/threonine protein phosphatase PrpC